MIDMESKAAIGTMYAVDTDLKPLYADVGYSAKKERLLADLRLVAGVETAHFGLRHFNGEPYVVLYVTIENHNDDDYTWNHINLVFADHAGVEV